MQAAGTKGKRYAMKNTRIMMTQPMGKKKDCILGVCFKALAGLSLQVFLAVQGEGGSRGKVTEDYSWRAHCSFFIFHNVFVLKMLLHMPSLHFEACLHLSVTLPACLPACLQLVGGSQGDIYQIRKTVEELNAIYQVFYSVLFCVLPKRAEHLGPWHCLTHRKFSCNV